MTSFARRVMLPAKLKAEIYELNFTKDQLDDRPEFDYRKKDLFTNYHYRLYPPGRMPGSYGAYGRGMPPGYRRQWSDEGGRMPQGSSQSYDDKQQQYDRSDYP